jgi:YVTN family beta-propeller protein
MLIDRLPENSDRIVMATDAPDYIQVYSPATRKSRMYPSDERMNDMKIDRSGERVLVATKEGWLNVFYPGQLGRRRVRHKLGDILQGVALSGDEKSVAIGLGNREDYNARDVAVYSMDKIENLGTGDVSCKAIIPMKGDIQAIVANPDPANNRGYIASSQDDKLTMFDFPTGQRLGFIEIGNSMGHFRCSPDGRKGYASINARQSVAAVDLTKGQEKTIAHVKLPTAPYYLAFNADGSRLYAGSRDTNQVYVIDTATDELIDTLILGNPFTQVWLTAELIGVSSDEEYLYVVPQYPVLIVYEMNREGTPLKPVQSNNFPKAPTIMEIMRPK